MQGNFHPEMGALHISKHKEKRSLINLAGKARESESLRSPTGHRSVNGLAHRLYPAATTVQFSPGG
jgi:hypothetical protein